MKAHKDDCKMAFGRKDKTCPRCQDLLAGAKPAEAWGAHKKAMEARDAIYRANHKCTESRCGLVCTAFEW